MEELTTNSVQTELERGKDLRTVGEYVSCPCLTLLHTWPCLYIAWQYLQTFFRIFTYYQVQMFPSTDVCSCFYWSFQEVWMRLQNVATLTSATWPWTGGNKRRHNSQRKWKKPPYPEQWIWTVDPSLIPSNFSFDNELRTTLSEHRGQNPRHKILHGSAWTRPWTSFAKSAMLYRRRLKCRSNSCLLTFLRSSDASLRPTWRKGPVVCTV